MDASNGWNPADSPNASEVFRWASCDEQYPERTLLLNTALGLALRIMESMPKDAPSLHARELADAIESAWATPKHDLENPRICA